VSVLVVHTIGARGIREDEFHHLGLWLLRRKRFALIALKFAVELDKPSVYPLEPAETTADLVKNMLRTSRCTSREQGAVILFNEQTRSLKHVSCGSTAEHQPRRAAPAAACC
jgi:hypothetical protein